MPYAAPRTLDDALTLLARNKEARVLAGGHTLLVEPERSRLGDRLLVDLRHVPDLTGITINAQGVTIGAMTTLGDIAANPTIRQSYAVLAELIEGTGDPQLRNQATIGGSLAHPGSEFRAVAVILAATVAISGTKKSRQVDADDLLAGTSEPGAGDVITAITLPPRLPRTGLALAVQRNSADRSPIAGAAVGVVVDDAGSVTKSRVVAVGVGERPVRLRKVERQLAGTSGEAALAAAAAAGDEVPGHADLFASADYRNHLTRVLAGRALSQALQRAGG